MTSTTIEAEPGRRDIRWRHAPQVVRSPTGGNNTDMFAGVFRHVGNTPLIELTNVTRSLAPDVRVYAKAEFMNPGGSVKDRAAGFILRDALEAGRLRDGKRLLDATSGNTGIAYAMLGAAMGVPVTLAMPENASEERKMLMRTYGAELLLTDKLEGTDGAQRYVKELAEKYPDRYVYADQYNNDANWKAHYETTGRELLRQTDGRISHFVAALGTGGTFTGTTRRMREYNPSIQAIAVQPDSPMHAIEGMKHMESSIVPGIYDASLVDRFIACSTDDARAMTRRLAEEEGLFVGVSAGANVKCAIEVAETLDSGVVVTVLCDTGARYLSDSFWSENGAADEV